MEMVEQFKPISLDEYNELKSSISLITVLIAGADGNIDKKEKEWAKKVTEIRSYSLPEGLKEFYLEVGVDFQDRLDEYISKYSSQEDHGRKAISEKLAKLNPILAKIEDREMAERLYKSLLSFAKHVAKASGGFLRWGAISPSEKDLISLDMIDPVGNDQ